MIEKTRPHKNQILIRLNTEITVQEAIRLREQLLDKVSEGEHHFILDVSGISDIDSTGLGVLVTLYKRVKPHQGTVTIRGAKESVEKLFSITRLTKVFIIE